MVDGKIEVEQNPTDLWTSALTRSVANEFKGLCDGNKKNLRNHSGIWHYG